MAIRRQLAAALLLAVAGAGVSAQQPLTEQFLYQGELRDQGLPADGNYDFEFRLFDASSGGSIVGIPILRPNTPVDQGYVQVSVNFGGIGQLFTGSRRWLEVSVRPAGIGSYTVLGRQELTATPHATYAINAGTTLDQAYGNGATIDADAGPVIIANSTTGTSELELGGTGARAGLLQMFNFNAVRTFEAGSLNPGGYAQGYGATGDQVWALQADASNWGGGLVNVYRRTGAGSGGGGTSFGIQLEGNWAGTEQSRLIMYGETGETNIQLAMDLTGDAAVQFPTDAINATEMLNEPGIASVVGTSNVILTPVAATLDTIASATITCPSSGYVLVIATCELSVTHVQGIESSIDIGVSASPQFLSTSQDIEVRIEGDSPNGLYDHPVTVHGVFPVSAGARTFYLVGDQNSAGHTVSALDSTISAIFVPTSYGTVTGSRETPGGRTDVLTPAQLGGQTPGQLAVEQGTSALANSERLAREVALMREQIARFERELAAEHAVQEGSR
jgi:hypothetical protein